MSTDPDAARVVAALERSHTEALDVMLGIHFPEDAPHPRVGHRPWAEMRREMLTRREAQAMDGNVEVWVDGDGRFVMDIIPAEELERSAVDLAHRTTMTTEEARDTLARASRTTGALVRELWVHLSHTVEEYAEALAALFDGMSEGPARPEPPEDPRERALWARRNRNTGPRPGRYRYDGTRRNG